MPQARLASIVLLATLPLVLGAGARPAGAQAGLSEGYRLVATWTDATPGSEVPPLDRPLGIDVADDDTVFVVDNRANQVHAIAPNGTGLAAWAPGDIGTAQEIAVSSDRVYVLGARAIGVHRRDGGFIRAVPVSGGRGIAFGPDRRVYVSRLDSGAQAVIDVHDVDGNRIETWRDDNIPIASAYGLDVGADGRVYLAGDGAVYVFTPNGAGGAAVTGLLRVRRGIEGSVISDVAVDAQNRVFAVLESGWLSAWEGRTASDVAFAGGRRLAVGPGAGLVVTTVVPGFNGISAFADRANLQAPAIRWGARSAALGELDAPRRVAVGAGRTVFLLDRLKRAQGWAPDGRPQIEWPSGDYGLDLAGGGARPCLVTGEILRCLGNSPFEDILVPAAAQGWLTAVDGDANRLATLDLARQRVEIHARDLSLSLQSSWPLAAGGGFVSIADLALDGDRVYLANAGSDRVEIHALDGTPLGAIEVPGGPLRVASAGGAIYALSRDGWVWKYAADLSLLSVWQPAADGAPSDLAAEAGGRVYVTDPKRDRVLVFEPGASPPDTLPPSADERCVVAVDKRAAPAEVIRGEPITVQLAVSGRCPLGDGRLDVVLVIDQSGSMGESPSSGVAPMAAAQSAALAFLNELNPQGAQVAVVGFATTAEVLQPLTSDLAAVVRAIGRLNPTGQTNYIEALEKALGEATGPAARTGVPRVVIMMTDGKPTNRLGVDRAAQAIKDVGASLYTIGLGPTIEPELLRSMASAPEYFFEAPTESELGDIYREIARRITAVRLLQRATVTDELPADMSLEAGSAVPPARVAGRTLTWELSEVPASGRILSYRLRPSQLGRRPTNVRAWIDYVDATGEPGQVDFPVPEVLVRERLAWQAYLPLAYRNRCQPQRADVVLVFDTSNSMLEPARAGSAETKLQAAIRAGRTFLEAMELPGDQAAVVAFNDDARLIEPLTGSRGALFFALASLSTRPGTRIDLGLQAASYELLSGRHDAGNLPVIVVLTDGRPAGGTESRALSAAREAQALGATVFAIGLGRDADMGLLSLIGGRRERSFYAPDAGALVGIYDQIAGKVLCEP